MTEQLRATQIVREAAVNPSNMPLRATSLVRESAVNPTNTPLRATSLVRESAVNPSNTPLRVTSVVREVLLKGPVTSWANPLGAAPRIMASDLREIQEAVDSRRRDLGWADFP